MDHFLPQSFSENIRFAAGNTGGFHNAAPKVQPIPYADRTLRPLALLLDRTLRPLEVAILFIKPCSLLRCLVLGLKVVFMACCTSFNQNHTLRGEKNSRTRRKNRHKILEHYFRLYEIPNFSSSFFHKFPSLIYGQLFNLVSFVIIITNSKYLICYRKHYNNLYNYCKYETITKCIIFNYNSNSHVYY